MRLSPIYQLTAEERLLIAVGKVDPAPHERALVCDLLGMPGFSWNRVFRLATFYRVHPMLAYNLQAHARLGLPGDVHETLRSFRAEAAMRQAVFTQQVAPIIESLRLAGISVALMKGVAISETLYALGTRLLHDFDVLIDKRDYKAVATAFAACGFSKVFRPGRSEAAELDSYHQIALVKTIGGSLFKVDLHWLMYPPEHRFCQIDTAVLMSRATPLQFGSASTLALSRADILVHYGSQLVNDSLRVGFQRRCDIYALVKSAPPWESMVEIATRAGAAGGTHLALSMAAALGASAPPWVLRQLRRACTGCQVTSRVFATPLVSFRPAMVPPAVRPFLIALLHAGRNDRITYLRRFVIASWRRSRAHCGINGSWWKAASHIYEAGRWLRAMLIGTPGSLDSTQRKEVRTPEQLTIRGES